jgi:hypothetical protein
VCRFDSGSEHHLSKSVNQVKLKKATMTPTKTFKFSKRNKTLMTLLPFKDQTIRNAFKRMMVDAQLCSGVVVKSSKDRGADNK